MEHSAQGAITLPSEIDYSRFAASIVETVREPLLVLDHRLRLITANPAFYRAFRVSPDETLGRPMFELGNGQWNIPALRRLLEDILARDSVFEDFEVEHDFESIGYRVMSLNARPIRDAGEGHLILLAIEDVTEHRALERRLQRALDEAERSNRDLQDFAYVASHDLQAPLRKILTFGDRLRNLYADAPDERGRDYLARMTGAAERMQVLIDDLLMYARINAGGPRAGEIDLAEVVDACVSDIETDVARHGARVNVGALPRVKGDPTHLQQVFQNLLGNALKYAREDEPLVIDVRADTEHERVGAGVGEFCTIRVSDNGIGFDGEYSERIFLPLERLHGRSRYGGSGMGLAICRKIIEQYGGTIRAEGVPGKGAEFVLTLPLAGSE